MSRCIELDRCGALPIAEVGGKAYGLGRLIEAGFEVAPGFVCTVAAYNDVLRENGLDREISAALAGADTTDEQQEALRAIRASLEQALLPSALVAEIGAAYRRLGCGAALPVAVRSSSTLEDLAAFSAAGQQESYLWVAGEEALIRQIARCWSSLFTPHALAYRARHGIAPEQVAMAVIVQVMVVAEVAGVMFTIDPVAGDPSQLVIEASYGLGLGVVGGNVTPDSFYVDKIAGTLRSTKQGEKRQAYRADAQHGSVYLADVAADAQQRLCLSSEQIRHLAGLGRRVERALGCAQDIEWALGPLTSGADAAFYLLQARPETAWSRQRSAPVVSAQQPVVARVAAMFFSGGRLPGTSASSTGAAPTEPPADEQR